MTPDTIAELERLEKLATAGPWCIRPSADGADFAAVNGANWFEFARVVIRFDDNDSPVGEANAALIAAARNALPDLLADYKRMREALEEIVALHDTADLGAEDWATIGKMATAARDALKKETP